MTSESKSMATAASPLDLPVRVCLILFLAIGIAASLLGDALWDEPVMAAFLAAGLAVIGIARFCVRQGEPAARNRWLTAAIIVGRGLLLGSLLLGGSMLSWFLAEVVSRGRSSEVELWLARMAIGLFLGAVAYLLLKPQARRGWEYARRALAWTLGIGIVGGSAGFLLWFGPADLSAYPPPQDSPYRLPWKPGVRRLCVQGNRTIISHWQWQEYAYDFAMPVGTEICAAREGRVTMVVDANDGNGPNAPGNEVVIFHPDGTFGAYLHIRQSGALVRVGDEVKQGDVIAQSGNVGMSTLPHVHFHVFGERGTIPITFADVPGDGVPRMFRRYRSGS